MECQAHRQYRGKSISSELSVQPLTVFQISITEAGGAEGRGSYFGGVGAIRDVMQNRKHLPAFRLCMSYLSPQT